MDRYWISREFHGRNKVVIPSVEDLDKYSKKEEQKKAEEDVLEEKAGICAEIVKLRYPGITDRNVVKEAAKLMHHSLGELLEIKAKSMALPGILNRYL